MKIFKMKPIYTHVTFRITYFQNNAQMMMPIGAACAPCINHQNDAHILKYEAVR